jgi:hypothetical protein
MTRAKDVGLGGSVVLIVLLIVLRVREIGVDDVPSVFPDGLETTL